MLLSFSILYCDFTVLVQPKHIEINGTFVIDFAALGSVSSS